MRTVLTALVLLAAVTAANAQTVDNYPEAAQAIGDKFLAEVRLVWYAAACRVFLDTPEMQTLHARAISDLTAKTLMTKMPLSEMTFLKKVPAAEQEGWDKASQIGCDFWKAHSDAVQALRDMSDVAMSWAETPLTPLP